MALAIETPKASSQQVKSGKQLREELGLPDKRVPDEPEEFVEEYETAASALGKIETVIREYVDEIDRIFAIAPDFRRYAELHDRTKNEDLSESEAQEFAFLEFDILGEQKEAWGT